MFELKTVGTRKRLNAKILEFSTVGYCTGRLELESARAPKKACEFLKTVGTKKRLYTRFEFCTVGC